MVEKNMRKYKAKKQRVLNGFNTGTRDMKSAKDYKRKKKWSVEDEQAEFHLFGVPQALGLRPISCQW